MINLICLIIQVVYARIGTTTATTTTDNNFFISFLTCQSFLQYSRVFREEYVGLLEHDCRQQRKIILKKTVEHRREKRFFAFLFLSRFLRFSTMLIFSTFLLLKKR